MRKIPKDMHKGSMFNTNNFGFVKVIEYIDGQNVLVEFTDTGNQIKCQSSHLRRGLIKDNFRPVIFGLAYPGDKLVCFVDKKDKEQIYACWYNMYGRCYNEKIQEVNKSYVGCTVDDEWFNFNKFAVWYLENAMFKSGKLELDKDLILAGNKTYGPKTCTLITHQENVEASQAKYCRLKSPEGKIIDVFNVSKFARENNLNQSHLNCVSLGKRDSHKGWTLYKEAE